jgi:hypothetical protein
MDGYGRGGSSLLGTVLTYKYCAVVVEGTVDQLPRDSVVVVEEVWCWVVWVVFVVVVVVQYARQKKTDDRQGNR